jgi:hypothetical protein
LIVPLPRRHARGEKRGDVHKNFGKPMNTPLAEGIPSGKSRRQPTEGIANARRLLLGAMGKLNSKEIVAKKSRKSSTFKES